jgi:hypothetical protein
MRSAILTLCLLALTSSSVAAQGWADKMFKDGSTHDFGTVPHGAQLLHRFTITNIYAVRMEITSIVPGCGCVTYNAPKRFLEPRESGVIEILMDAKRFTGPKSVSIRVSVGPEFISTAELKVTANSRADIVFNPGQINFGTVARGQTPTQTMDVEYAGTLPWQVTEVVAKDLPLDTTFKDLYRRPGQVGVQLAVTLKADAAPGPFKEYVYLRTNDPATPLVGVLVEAHIVAPVTVTPSSLRLTGSEKVKIGEVVTRRVIIKGTRPFKVLGVDGGGPEIVSGGEFGPPAAQQTIVLRCRFNEPGDFKREVRIKTELQPEPLIVVVEANVVP